MSADTWNRLTGRNTYPPGRLLGAKVWDGTKVYLESHGHRVSAPGLPDEHTHTLNDHIDSVCSLILTSDLHTVILVGHSYGGMVITGVAAQGGWSYLELPTSHVPMATMPQRFYRLMGMLAHS